MTSLFTVDTDSTIVVVVVVVNFRHIYFCLKMVVQPKQAAAME
jgi:hypothetical protein